MMADVVEVSEVTMVTARADPLPFDEALTSWDDIKEWQLDNVLPKLGLENTPEHRKWVMFATNDNPGSELAVATTIYSNGIRELVISGGLADCVVKIKYAANGIKVWQEYTYQGKYHHTEEPAWVEWADDGRLLQETYYYDGRKMRLNGPAETTYYIDNNSVHRETWFYDGMIRNINENEPARILYYRDGTIQTKIWYTNEVRSRREDYDQQGNRI